MGEMARNKMLLIDLAPLGCFTLALISDIHTTGVKATSGGWIGNIGDFSLKAYRFHIVIGIDFGYGGKERFRVRMLGTKKEFLGRRKFHEGIALAMLIRWR